MLHATALSALLCWLGCAALIVLGRRRHFGLDETQGVQKWHRHPTPRTGGFALALGLMVGLIWLMHLTYVSEPVTIRLAVAIAPVLLAGVVEDLRRHVPPLWRALATVLAAGLAVWLLEASVTRLGLWPLDAWIHAWPVLGWLIALVAISALPHAVNMIDGYNGLAGMVSFMIFGAIGYVAFKVSDPLIMALSLAAIGALLGFLFWNWPRGQIFLGDTGAYLLGFWMALLSVLLVARNPAVSPWFALMVLAYPVWELLYSLWRRKFRQRAGTAPDTLHLHHLVYWRLTRLLDEEDHPDPRQRRNAATSPYLWAVAAFSVGPAMLWWGSTPLLMACCVGFVTLYLLAYRLLVQRRI
ncbi:MAG: glycosyltransferase family 4 protein [Thiomonas sp.]|jgi:UDP-N-acetylmuramyl pentapeptide phosphotransferase/UDP-N-acetylglucosamine-1-phosphate transferase